MGFDLSSATPVQASPSGFDLSSAQDITGARLPSETFAQTAAKYGLVAQTHPGNTAYPVTDELATMARNFMPAAGMQVNDWWTRLRQLYSAATGNGSMDAEIAEKRKFDAPLNAAPGSTAGRMFATTPGAIIAGPSVAGGALYGGTLGFMQPTTSQDRGGNLGATAINTGAGGLTGAAGAAIGNWLSRWATQRSEYPFMGWTPASADTELARAVGSDAPALNQAALGRRAGQLSDIFNTGRSAATGIDLAETPAAIDEIAADMNPSARAAFENNQNVMDLMSHATGPGSTNGQALGRISTGLRQDAYSALNSEGGNREVGNALRQLREHVEDAIQSNIADPALQASYAAARPQYGLLEDVRFNPTVLNASTGRANMEALGRYLQRNNPAYTSENAMDNPLFNAATWGQRGGGAKGIPSFSLAKPWQLPAFAATHNPAARALGGAVSNTLAPVAPVIPGVLSGAGTTTLPTWLPYLTQ